MWLQDLKGALGRGGFQNDSDGRVCYGWDCRQLWRRLVREALWRGCPVVAVVVRTMEEASWDGPQ